MLKILSSHLSSWPIWVGNIPLDCNKLSQPKLKVEWKGCTATVHNWFLSIHMSCFGLIINELKASVVVVSSLQVIQSYCITSQQNILNFVLGFSDNKALDSAKYLLFIVCLGRQRLSSVHSSWPIWRGNISHDRIVLSAATKVGGDRDALQYSITDP